jgi:hypothetical protein
MLDVPFHDSQVVVDVIVVMDVEVAFHEAAGVVERIAVARMEAKLAEAATRSCPQTFLHDRSSPPLPE